MPNNFGNLSPEQRRASADRARETRRAKKVETLAQDITFGIEIECFLPFGKVHDWRINIGDHGRGNHLPEPFPAGWRAEDDGSLIDAPDGYTSCELVSPVLSGLDGIQQVVKVFELLDEDHLNARVTKTCGQHVHIGMRSVLGSRANDFDMVSEWVRRLLHLVAKNETALFAICGSEVRFSSTYCLSVKQDWKNYAGKSLSWQGLQNASSHIDRYHSLNVKNLFTVKKTVEFRVFFGTLTAVKAIGYIVTAIGMAQKAAVNTAVAAWDEEPLQTTADTEYYKAAVLALQSRLGWLKNGVVHFGFVPEVWERYGELVKRNQLWNADHLAKRIAAARG